MSKVLIVDDQPGIRVLLQEILKKDGHKVLEAGTADTALALTRKEDPDLILLDMKIPGMNGIEILEVIREEKYSCPVIMMTAYEELNMLNKAEELGVVSHFPKPFDIEEMRQVVLKCTSCY
ncbi:response regulator [Salsuginibacillus kocurii]|uniref:response regulator n=1 Tax=Salsuginibacillus kocurii TaxID=427078 RepID=UPI00035FE223|nr:response regulator [Salsuginibacillus kocurii]